jgi:hypothetical protein
MEVTLNNFNRRNYFVKTIKATIHCNAFSVNWLKPHPVVWNDKTRGLWMSHYSTDVKRLFTHRVLTCKWNFANTSCSYIEVLLYIAVIITLFLCSCYCCCCCYWFVEIMHLRNSASKLAVRITQTAIKIKEILYKPTRSNNSSPLKNLKTHIF